MTTRRTCRASSPAMCRFHHERARRAGAPVARVPFRRRRKRRPHPLPAARPAIVTDARRRRSGAARRRRDARREFQPRAGNRPAAGLAHRLYRRRRRLPPGGGRGPAARRRSDRVAESALPHRARSGRGHRHRRTPVAGCVDHARDRDLRAAAVAACARSRRRDRAHRRRPRPSPAHRPKSTMRPRAPSSAVATDPSIYDSLVGPERGVGGDRGIAQTGRALVEFLDLPLLTGNEVPWSPHVAVRAEPVAGRRCWCIAAPSIPATRSIPR